MSRGLIFPVLVGVLVLGLIGYSQDAYADFITVTHNQITSSSMDEITPTIGNDGNSDIVVYNKIPGAGVIEYQRLNLDGSPNGTPVLISSGSTDDRLNDVSGNRIVYTATLGSGLGEVTVFEIDTGVRTSITVPTLSPEAKIHGDNVAWTEASALGTQIRVFDLTLLGTGTSPLTLGFSDSKAVEIGSRFVVWQEDDGSDSDVMAYDLGSGFQFPVSANSGIVESSPSTDGDLIVWQFTGTAGGTGISYMDVSTFTTIVVIDDGANNLNPSVSGDFISYESDVNGNFDVFVHRISDGQTFQVTTSSDDQTLNGVFGNLISYATANSSDDSDIFVTSFDITLDSDGDLILDSGDNCVLVPNPKQLDFDKDGLGNVCDTILLRDTNVLPLVFDTFPRLSNALFDTVDIIEGRDILASQIVATLELHSGTPRIDLDKFDSSGEFIEHLDQCTGNLVTLDTEEAVFQSCLLSGSSLTTGPEIFGMAWVFNFQDLPIVTNTATVFSVLPDSDGDGITDSIDVNPTNKEIKQFNNGLSSGDIVIGGDNLSIIDAPGSAIQITAIGPATINACGTSSITFTTGQVETLCGSVTINVIHGQVDVEFNDENGLVATSTLSMNDNITFDDDSLEFINNNPNTAVIITVDGNEVEINPGDKFVLNNPPTAQANGPYLVPINTATELDSTGSFDPDGDTLTYQWSTTSSCTFNDATLANPLMTCIETGIFDVTLQVTDTHGASDSDITSIVVYDPTGGFVTGGGWINSPTGAYAADESLTGKANFGFVSKYKKGADIPTGVTEFQFKVASLNFHSDVYEWLVVAGSDAKFKGTGTINGAGNYGFMVTANDADVNKNDANTDDKFRIKIWDKDNGDEIVYDNQMGASDGDAPTTAISGGSIVVHSGKGK